MVMLRRVWKDWEAFIGAGLRWLVDGQSPKAQWAIVLAIITIVTVMIVLSVVALAHRMTGMA